MVIFHTYVNVYQRVHHWGKVVAVDVEKMRTLATDTCQTSQ
jgi:hypothetical protein